MASTGRKKNPRGSLENTRAKRISLCAMGFMRVHDGQLDSSDEDAHAIALPPGTPEWVTVELVAVTLRVWQRYYDAPLSVDDAVTMLLNAGQLYSALARR